MREMISKELFSQNPGTRERGAVWQAIATTLNSLPEFSNATQRGVRDRFMNIMKKFTAATNKEIRSTGLGGDDITERDVLLEELTALHQDTEKRYAEGQQLKKSNEETERNAALDIRNRAMERHSETKKRKADDE